MNTYGLNSEYNSLLNKSNNNKQPPVNLTHRNNKYHISLEIPGIKQHNIDLEISGRYLVIKAKHNFDTFYATKDNPILSERNVKDINRFIYMPVHADLDRVEPALYKDGVLYITIPEINTSLFQTKPKSIPILSNNY